MPRMSMPHPGLGAWRAAQALFKVEDPSRDQCLAAVDLMGAMRADGLLPRSEGTAVIYPERPGAGLCLCTGAVQDRVEDRVRKLFGTVPA
jgi:hypothetical protein